MNSESSNAFTHQYEIKQYDHEGLLLSSLHVDAESSAAAARKLKGVNKEADRIEVCLDGEPMNQMTVTYWQTRIRKR
jgi:hypothetical protein